MMRLSVRIVSVVMLTLLVISFGACSGETIKVLERATAVIERNITRYKEPPQSNIRPIEYGESKTPDPFEMTDFERISSRIALYAVCRLPGRCL